MIVCYTRDDARRRITVIAEGALTTADILTNIERQIAEGAWTYAVLYETSELPDDLEPLRTRLRQAAQQHGRRGPLAVVGRSPAIFEVARGVADLNDSVGPLAFFLTRAAAEHWLEEHERSDESHPP